MLCGCSTAPATSTASSPLEATTSKSTTPLAEVSLLALKLGFTAFGGPAAHIAMLRDEVVVRRQWITEQHFLDLLGATNLIPGPNSTQMVIHVGWERAGWKGLIAAGALFILPAAVMVGLLAWAYTLYGTTPAGEWLLYGIKPVIIAVVLQALWALGRTAVKGPFLAVVGLTVLVLSLLGFNVLALLFGGGLLVMLVRNAGRLRGGTAVVAPVLAAGGAAAGSFSLGTLFLTFLKIGCVLYGGGYVLLAFVRNDFVHRLGWLTDRQLLDAVAVGQFTPGPLFTTATFIGFLCGGWPGAAVATTGIFLPSFLLVALVNPFVPRLRASPWMAALLDGVNVSAVGLMTAVAWELGRAAITDWLTTTLAVAAAVLLVRFKVNSAWLVLGGGGIGLAWRFLH